jgi:hypothetical protein
MLIRFSIDTLEDFNSLLKILKDNDVGSIDLGEVKIAFMETEEVPYTDCKVSLKPESVNFGDTVEVEPEDLFGKMNLMGFQNGK